MSVDPDNICAVIEWPTLTSRTQLQRFLGFTNFSRKFIKNLSMVASPLPALTSQNNHFLWTLQAEEGFQLFKERFRDAPVLTLPDPKLQFIVEVDAADVRIGAVLSQRRLKNGSLHPCTFLSNTFSPLTIMILGTENYWQPKSVWTNGDIA